MHSFPLTTATHLISLHGIVSRIFIKSHVPHPHLIILLLPAPLPKRAPLFLSLAFTQNILPKPTNMYTTRDSNSVTELPNRKPRNPPSFSSALLDEIYSSIDNDKQKDFKDVAHKRIDTKHNKKKSFDTKNADYNNDALFFSSGSNSSDSNSSLFSDQDSIQLPTPKTRSSCFLPPKPIRTKTTLPKTEQDDVVPKSSTKSRALKMYAHLKKMKQPISPGMKLTTFINSILHNSKSKRGAASSSDEGSKKPTTKCSSATSFGRSRALYLNEQTTPCCKVEVEAERLRTVKLKRDDEGRSSASSDCSEDLFEIDHLKLRFTSDGGGELPVYETTTSRDIDSRLRSAASKSRGSVKGKCR